MALKSFPPYGFLPAHFAAFVNDNPVADFEPDKPHRKDIWLDFFHDTLKIFNQNLWPSFDPVRGDWDTSGRSVGFDEMKSLTDADFRVLKKMVYAPMRGLGEFPKGGNRKLGCLTHEDLFIQEDGRRKEKDGTELGDGFAAYNRDLPSDIAAAARSIIDTAIRKKDIGILASGEFASLGMPFKAKLQRPRPYQIAMMMGIEEFRHERANTSPSPSMISGHTAHGINSMAALIERLILEDRSPKECPREPLRQFMVDIGDRRVMAGVHYPSDNVSSWMLGLLIAEHTFRSNVPEIRREIWKAISEHSVVYAHIKEDVDQLGAASGFYRGFAKLHGIAKDKGATNCHSVPEQK